MSFLNPLFLLGVLAVAGPILVHLFRRQDAKKVAFSSLMFIRHAPNRSWRRLRLRHLLLLAARSLAIILLVLAFARPYFTRDSQASLGAGQKSVVVLIDTSFSMRASERMQRARNEASAVFGQLGERDATFLVGFSDVSQLVGEPRSRPDLLIPMIADLQPSYRGTNYRQAVKLAGQLLSSAPNDVQEIHLISDFQLSGWDEGSESLAMADNVHLILHDVSGSDEFNVVLGPLEISETGHAGQSQAKVAARISSDGGFSGPVRLAINGKVIQEKPVTIEKGRSATVEFAPFPVGGMLTRGSVRLNAADSLPDDDAAFFVLNPQSRQRVLMLTGSENSRDKAVGEDLFIRQALMASSRTPFDVKVEKVSEAASLDLAPYSGVLLYNPGRVPPRLADQVKDFVSKGGGLVIVVGDRTDSSELNDKFADILPATLGRKQSDAKGISLVANLQKRHGVFQVFEPVHQSYFLSTPFRRYVESTPVSGSASLMQLEGNRPLLVEKASGKGRVLLFTSAFNTDWNDLPLKSVFLPFCHEVMKYAMNFEGTARSFAVGESVPVGRLNSNLEKAVTGLSTAAFRQGWKVVSPSGRVIDLSEEELLKSPFLVLDEPGFYETEVRNFKNSVAVNIAGAESDLRKLDAERFVAAVQRIPAASGEGWAGAYLSPEKRDVWETRQSVWWYLVLLALTLLLLEGYLAARYGRVETH